MDDNRYIRAGVEEEEEAGCCRVAVLHIPTQSIYQDSFRQPRFQDTWRSITADRRHGAPPLCPRVSPHLLVITLEHPTWFNGLMECVNKSSLDKNKLNSYHASLATVEMRMLCSKCVSNSYAYVRTHTHSGIGQNTSGYVHNTYAYVRTHTQMCFGQSSTAYEFRHHEPICIWNSQESPNAYGHLS
eukprot:scaffold1752_cov197-Alexandrium_tamarense.AAC.1